MFSKKLKTTFFFILISLLFPIKTNSALWINEIYPAPSLGDELVELYNDQPISIDISTHTLTDATNKKITLNDKIIKPFGYSIGTSSAVLNNSGPETIYLKDNLGNILDTVTYSDTFTSLKSFVRCPDGGSLFFVTTIITSEYTNSGACDILLAPTPTTTPAPTITPTITTSPSPTPTPSPTASPTPTPASFNNIYLSEVMIDPEENQDEWVEIYNDNDFTVTLVDWYLDDTSDSGSSPRKFTLTIGPKSYGTVDLTSSVFNNSGDSVRILDALNIQKDSYEYTDSSKGKSQGRSSQPAGTFCQQEPTKGALNGACILQSIKSASSQSSSNSSPTVKKLKAVPILTPKTAVIGRPKIQPVAQKINQTPKFVNKTAVDGDILGASNSFIKDQNTTSYLAISRSLAFASCSYSILLLTWILIKKRKI